MVIALISHIVAHTTPALRAILLIKPGTFNHRQCWQFYLCAYFKRMDHYFAILYYIAHGRLFKKFSSFQVHLLDFWRT